MNLVAPVAANRIKQAAETAAWSNQNTDVSTMMTLIQEVSLFAVNGKIMVISSVTFFPALTRFGKSQGFAVFDYINLADVTTSWYEVLLQTRLQLSLMEPILGVPYLVDWWDAFIADYFWVVQTNAQTWAYQVIGLVWDEFSKAADSGATPLYYDQVFQTLAYFTTKIPLMALPGMPGNSLLTLPGS